MRVTAQAIAYQQRQERIALANVGTVQEFAAETARIRRETKAARLALAAFCADWRATRR